MSNIEWDPREEDGSQDGPMIYCHWLPKDVEEVIASSEGYNDGDSWIALCKLKDGKYGATEAGCDYTGWD